MGKSRTGRARPETIDPEAILAGRAVADAGALIEAIHAANPTGRDLPEPERRRRYALKSRLQSLLIRRYPALLRLSRGRDPGVLVIDCTSGRNACHARIDELDEDARAYALHQLDLAEHGDEAVHLAPPSPAAGRPPGRAATQATAGGRAAAPDAASADDDPLALGERLLGEYDYEGARDAFTAALTGSGGAAGPARRLLALLVEELGADDDALALRPQLSAAALRDGEVRLLLGTGAARAGRRDLAEDLLSEERRPAAALGWTLLARQALREGDLDQAETALDRARAVDPVHPDLVVLSGEIDAARAAARRPDEEALAALLAAGDLDGAEARARALLGRDPRAAAAHRALRAIDDRRRAAQAERLLAEAAAAEAEGDDDRAIGLLIRARDTGVGAPLRDEIAARIEALSRRQREAREARRIAQARAALAAPDRAAGLLAYAALPPALRRRLRVRPLQLDDPAGPSAPAPASAPPAPVSPSPPAPASQAAADAAAPSGTSSVAARTPPSPSRACPWADLDAATLEGLLELLDVMLGARPDTPPRTAVDALLAMLTAARRALADPEGALGLLTQHARSLDMLDSFHELEEALRQILEAARRCALTTVFLVLEAGAGEPTIEPEAVLRSLDAIELRLLPEALRERYEQVHRYHVVRRDLKDRMTQLEAAQAAGDLLGARAVAVELIARAADGEEKIGPVLRQLDQQIRVQFWQWVCEGPGPDSELWDQILDISAPSTAKTWLLPRENAVVFVRCLHAALFVRIYDLAAGRVIRRAVMLLPEPLDLLYTQADEHGVWILGKGGALLQLAAADLRILRWRRAKDLPPTDGLVHAQVIGGRYLWRIEDPRELGSLTMCQGGAVHVIDLDHPRSPRHLGERTGLLCAPGPAPLVLCPRRSGAIAVHDPRGALLYELPQDPPLRLHEAAPRPDGDGWLLLTSREAGGPAPASALGDRALRIERLRPQGERSIVRDLGTCSPWSLPSLIADAGRCLLRSSDDDGRALAMLRPEGGALIEESRVPLSADCVLVRDAAAARSIVVDLSGAAVVATPAAALRAAPGPVLPRLCLDPVQIDICLVGLAPQIVLETDVVQTGMQHATAETCCDLALDLWRQRRAVAPWVLLFLTDVVRGHCGVDAVEQLCARIERDEREALPRLYVAHALAAVRRFAAVVRVLDATAPEALAEDPRRHLHHLRGVALLFLGEGERAAVDLEQVESLGDRICMVGAIDELCPGGLTGRPCSDESGRAAVRVLRRLVEDADGLLAIGQPHAALAVLDHPVLWRSGELQSLARLVNAFLLAPPEDEIRRHRAGLAIAMYRRLVSETQLSRRRELPFPGHVLADEQLEEIAVRGARWLSAEIRRRVPDPADPPPATERTEAPAPESGTGAAPA